ncbi:ADP-ribosylglycohydrolase [Aquibacillus halophilus]|uniref:ADP-ribosylglycohydrolase n=1 Tax=Aquibacillus halophilus TaxID=930132 RepID=A0A6A8DC39_9BACI|nr:ADP-ribosylglycohydrolase family protein [Aquibacillus halophilus]MRH41341.1 ADP-ribosylglycohydrolase [Aquibacillus halophilus]
MRSTIVNGIMGLCVADALGVPVEFIDRESLQRNPVVDMRSYGTYNQPAGTWSDDTSMTLCLLDSLSNGLDYEDIMINFHKWLNEGAYTPHGEVFDIGISTKKALERFSKGIPPLECGGMTENDNGNGSLMRILPIVFYLQFNYRSEEMAKAEVFHLIHDISTLTHAHKRSQIACAIYVSIASNLVYGMSKEVAVSNSIHTAFDYYKNDLEFTNELNHFKRIKSRCFEQLPESQIKSSGYVVDTLEAAIWCLLSTNSYKDCVLKAVNLGEDTDTVAAVVGGLAGIFYGLDSIPKQWLTTLVKREYIEGLCDKLKVSFVE